MGTPDHKSEDWYKEFQQLNATPAKGTPLPPPSAPAAPVAPAAPLASAPNEPAGGKSERRHHGRFELEEAQVSLIRHGLLTVIGMGRDNLARSALDLSEGGARILLRERLKPGTRVKLRIEIEKFNDALEAAAEVRWCFECGTRPGDFYAGIQFVGLEDAQKRKIAVMRDYFNSPQAKAVRTAHKRPKGSPTHFPKPDPTQPSEKK
jgi:hypothetical protein